MHNQAFQSRGAGGEQAPSLPLPLAGQSDAVSVARQIFAAAARSRAPVLVTAETGCRPGDIARALHDLTRRDQPFIWIDCLAGSGEVERRLFGQSHRDAMVHDTEASGADGAIVQAANGTLFLENVEELPASVQRRLARVLRDEEIHVAGSGATVATGFRMIASTAHDLERDAREGRFRLDLLRRLAASSLKVPPLRQRPEDIPEIVSALPLQPAVVFTSTALTLLLALPWTRNIDELVEVVSGLAPGPRPIRPEDVLVYLPMHGTPGRVDFTASLREARRQFERQYIAAVLHQHGGSVSEAARTLGIERANLYRKVRQIGLVLSTADRNGGHRP